MTAAGSDARQRLSFLLLLLGLFLGRLFGSSLAFFVGLGLALLDDFGLGRSCARFGSGCVRRSDNFFLHRSDVSDRLIGLADEFELLIFRQVGYAQHFAESEFADVDIDVAWDVAGQALDFNFAQNVFEDATFGFYADGHALQNNGNADAKGLIHGDALEVDVQQVAFDGLVLPVDDHGFGALAIEGEIENAVVTAIGAENAQHVAGIDG